MRQNKKTFAVKSIIIPGTVCVLAAFAFHGCDGGEPSIDYLVLSYDIVAQGDMQGVQWGSSGGNSAHLTVTGPGNNGGSIYSEDVPLSSEGVHPFPTDTCAPGEYEVTLRVTNENGSTERRLAMLVVGSEGVWFDFKKYVDRPKVHAWTGFEDQVVPVSTGQGRDDADSVVSVSKYVGCAKIKWTSGIPWPDCEEARWMTIRKSTQAQVFRDAQVDIFPWPSLPGSYYCTSIWEPCALGTDALLTYFTLSFNVRSTR